MGKGIDLMQMQKLIEKAEKIVSATIKDLQLKPVAFERILDFLLCGTGTDFEGKMLTERLTKIRKSTKAMKTKKSEGPKLWLEEIIDEDFFKTPKNLREILATLVDRDHHLKSTDLQPYLRIFMKEKRLRRKKQVSKEGGKPVWHYSNW